MNFDSGKVIVSVAILLVVAVIAQARVRARVVRRETSKRLREIVEGAALALGGKATDATQSRSMISAVVDGEAVSLSVMKSTGFLFLSIAKSLQVPRTICICLEEEPVIGWMQGDTPETAFVIAESSGPRLINFHGDSAGVVASLPKDLRERLKRMEAHRFLELRTDGLHVSIDAPPQDAVRFRSAVSACVAFARSVAESLVIT